MYTFKHKVLRPAINAVLQLLHNPGAKGRVCTCTGTKTSSDYVTEATFTTEVSTFIHGPLYHGLALSLRETGCIRVGNNYFRNLT
jgi:hypothetical protein